MSNILLSRFGARGNNFPSDFVTLRGENLLLTLFLCKLSCTDPLFSESSLHSLRLPGPPMGSIHQSERGLRVKTPVSSASSSTCHTAWPAPPAPHSPVGDYSQQLEDEYAGSSTAAGPVGERVMDKTISTSKGLQCTLCIL